MCKVQAVWRVNVSVARVAWVDGSTYLCRHLGAVVAVEELAEGVGDVEGHGGVCRGEA